MDYEIRYASVAEFAAIAELDGASFGFHYAEQELADAQLDVDPGRVVVAVAGTKIIGLSAELPFAMLVPGGESVPVVGLSWVSVEVTHRRQGVLRAMVERQLREQAAQSAVAVILSAGEGGIYGRYGFGVATEVRHTVVERRRARLFEPVDTSAVERLSSGCRAADDRCGARSVA